MSPYLWNTFLILAAGRGLYHLLRPHFAAYGQLIFWAVVSLACIASFCALAFVAAPLTMLYVGVWVACGLAGWFIPELWHQGWRLLQGLPHAVARTVGPLTWGKAFVIYTIVMLILAWFNQDDIGRLGTIWAAPLVLWLIITKGFSLGASPAKKPRRRRR
ncbi:MAG TPA: hypothetical protein VGN56_02695 [Candidatus Paceibacterota bacterium]|jgi:hypothetical protein|nr:hypothetical protein [Candidatus Paceibacterota bacterium]